jgi:hypothetical protein
MPAAAGPPLCLVLREFLQRPLARLVATLATHVSLAVADPAIVSRQLAEVDLVRAALRELAVAAVACEAVLEGRRHPSSIEHRFAYLLK